MNAIFASLDHLTAGHARNKASVDEAIDAIVSAHQHGGKDAFDDRVDALRSALANTYATMDAVCDTARTAVGMPAGVVEPKAVAETRAPVTQHATENVAPTKKA